MGMLLQATSLRRILCEAFLGMGLLVSLCGLAEGQAAKPQPKQPSAADWVVGQKVEVKWGISWREAFVSKKQGEWLAVRYTPGNAQEWVEPWRIRKLGSKEDNLPAVHPNGILMDNQGPPKEKPDPAPAKDEAPRVPGTPREEKESAFTDDPAFKKADASAARQVALKGDPGPWKVALDPAPDRKAAAGSTPLKGAPKAEFFSLAKALFASRGPTPMAIVGCVNEAPGADAVTRVEVIDLVNGKSVAVHEVTAQTTLMDASPDGTLALLGSSEWGGAGRKRLEVWSLEGERAKRTLIFMPYDDLRGLEIAVAQAMFLDAGHVLTVNDSGKMRVWDLGTCKAVYQCQLDNSSRPVLSGGMKYLAVEAGKGLLLIEPLTGKVLGKLEGEGMGGGYSFSPSGRQLAGYVAGKVRVWDLGTGKLWRDFSVPLGGGSFAAVRDGYGLMGGSLLIDFERRITLWSYANFREGGAVMVGGKCVIARQPTDGPWMLTVVEVPHAAALALARTLTPEELLLLKRGAKVSLVVNAGATDQDRKQIADSLTKRLAANQIVVADNQPIRFVASQETGKSQEREYRPIGAGPFAPAQKVTVTPQIVKLALEVDGKAAWQASNLSTALGMLMLKQGQTIDQAVAEATKPNYGFLKTVELPMYVTKPKDSVWYGTSKFPGE